MEGQCVCMHRAGTQFHNLVHQAQSDFETERASHLEEDCPQRYAVPIFSDQDLNTLRERLKSPIELAGKLRDSPPERHRRYCSDHSQCVPDTVLQLHNEVFALSLKLDPVADVGVLFNDEVVFPEAPKALSPNFLPVPRSMAKSAFPLTLGNELCINVSNGGGENRLKQLVRDTPQPR